MPDADKRVSGIENTGRRRFLGTLCGLPVALAGMTGMAEAGISGPHDTGSLEQRLALVLRSVGSKESLDAAETLVGNADPNGPIVLHLRRAGILAAHAESIANTLTSASATERSRLRSFSLSYNRIGDTGAAACARALPESTEDVGLVGCSIGDVGGEAILDWATNARGLRMICIENNAMSETLRRRFRDLASASRGVSVYV